MDITKEYCNYAMSMSGVICFCLVICFDGYVHVYNTTGCIICSVAAIILAALIIGANVHLEGFVKYSLLTQFLSSRWHFKPIDVTILGIKCVLNITFDFFLFYLLEA